MFYLLLRLTFTSLLLLKLCTPVQGYPQTAPTHVTSALHMQPLEEVVKHSGLFWPPWVVRRVLDDTLRGLVYLHSHEPPIIHRGMSVSLCLAIHMFQILWVLYVCVCVWLCV